MSERVALEAPVCKHRRANTAARRLFSRLGLVVTDDLRLKEYVCRNGISGTRCDYRSVIGVEALVELVAHQNAFILDAVADQMSVVDDAALDETGQTYQLAQLALEVELVALAGDQIDVAFAGVDELKEIINVDIAQRPYCTHY